MGAKADGLGGPREQHELRERAVKVLEEGYGYFKDKGETQARAFIAEGIQRETNPKGDLENLEQAQKYRLFALIRS